MVARGGERMVTALDGELRFALAPGHTPEALGHPMMQRLIRNAMNWLLRMD